jgi:uncharacterized phiE125 gp8 family phage protein
VANQRAYLWLDMAIKIKTPPASEPITLSEGKSYLRVTDNNDDGFITALILAVRRRCEDYTQRALITQTWTLWLDRMGQGNCGITGRDAVWNPRVSHDVAVDGSVILPRPPLQSVTAMNSYAVDNSATLFSAEHYFVDTASEPGRICLNAGAVWPAQGRRFNAYEIEFVAGYGATGSSVPEGLKQGMLLLLKTLFAGKTKFHEPDEPHSLASVNDRCLPEMVKGLWNPYRMIHL